MHRRHGADAFRWYLYTAAPPGQERRFSAETWSGGTQVVRNFTLTLWNVYSFFVTYANLYGWSPAHTPDRRTVESDVLDRWLLSELHALIRQVTGALEAYDVPGATRPIEAFVDDLSSWYLRRSRRRFSETADEDEKGPPMRSCTKPWLSLASCSLPACPSWQRSCTSAW